MSAAVSTVALPARSALRGSWSLSRAAGLSIGRWLLRHAISLAIMTPLLGFVATVHATGSRFYPSYMDDAGVYLAQAWSVVNRGDLSPYTYFYDHTPGGWVQVGLWAALTGGFYRYRSALDFGAEVALIAKVAAAGMLYAFGRRLGFSRPGAAFAVVLFGLCPLGIFYGRMLFLDNIMLAWLLAAFAFAYAPTRSIGAATGATVSFAMAVLSKETALVLLPAFAWALASNLDRRNRQQVLTVSIFCGALVLSMYPLLALYKGELFPSSDHTSLLGTAAWQLVERPSSGWLWDSGSGVRTLLSQWFNLDPYLLIAGIVTAPLAIVVPRLRPVALALLIGWLMLARGGHVPSMYVVVLLPFSALLVAGTLEALSGNRRVTEGSVLRVRTKRIGRVVRGWYSLLLGLILLAGTALVWTAPIQAATAAHGPQPLRQAADWLGTHAQRDRVLVVHDAIWTDLVQRYGFSPPIMADKLDHDPQVRQGLSRIDYLAVPESYYRNTNPDAYPTLLQAREHAVEVAAFGSGDRAVHVYRVSSLWSPCSSTGTGCAAPTRPQTLVSVSQGFVWQRHPFHEAKLFVDRDSVAAHWQADNGAAWLEPITKTPQAVWLTSEWDLVRLPTLVREAKEQEALLVVVTYFIPNRDCDGHGADTASHYLSWTDRILEALGPTPAAVIMEPDAVPAPCFTPERADLLRQSVIKLSDAGHYVYLDAGHSRWLSTAEAARRLLASGIQHANGFSLNVANRQTTESNQQYGLELSNLVGDREFIIDTSRNGLGPPPDDPYRDDEWCNPTLQALGESPTTLPLPMRTAALLWIKRPGESDGPCRGETGFGFSPAQARNLLLGTLRLPSDVRDEARAAQISQTPTPAGRKPEPPG